MSGEFKHNTVDRETVLFTFDNFTIHPAKYWIKEMDVMEDGYAVIYLADDVVQLYAPNIAGAIQHAVGSDQTLQYMAAMEEAKTLEVGTEGLLDSTLPGDGDVIN